jgi:hypothetical protein
MIADDGAGTLTVRLHKMTNQASHEMNCLLPEHLNATANVNPGVSFRLRMNEDQSLQNPGPWSLPINQAFFWLPGWPRLLVGNSNLPPGILGNLQQQGLGIYGLPDS